MKESEINSGLMMLGILGITYLLVTFYIPFLQPGGIQVSCEKDPTLPFKQCVTAGFEVGNVSCIDVNPATLIEPIFCLNGTGSLTYMEPMEED